MVLMFARGPSAVGNGSLVPSFVNSTPKNPVLLAVAVPRSIPSTLMMYGAPLVNLSVCIDNSSRGPASFTVASPTLAAVLVGKKSGVCFARFLAVSVGLASTLNSP